MLCFVENHHKIKAIILIVTLTFSLTTLMQVSEASVQPSLQRGVVTSGLEVSINAGFETISKRNMNFTSLSLKNLKKGIQVSHHKSDKLLCLLS